MRYADVIVPLAVEGMYTYTVPVSLESEVREGTLVLVSFAGNKRYTALVGRIHDQAPVGYQVNLSRMSSRNRFRFRLCT